MATETRRWTRADLERMPENGKRYEVLDGELFVTPQAAGSHQRIAFLLAVKLELYVQAHLLGVVVPPGAVIVDDNELQPDIQVIPDMTELPVGSKWEAYPRALLVVEVLSESTKGRDLGKKRRAYARFGIPYYWIVDSENRRVLVFTTDAEDPAIVTESLTWQPRAHVPAFEILVASILPADPRQLPGQPANQ